MRDFLLRGPLRAQRILVMLGRVRRGDVVLAAVGVAGVLAGLVVTVGTRLGVTGPALIAIGVVAAIAGALPLIRAQVSSLASRQRDQRDRLAAILAVPIQPVAKADPFRIGVFPSDLAQRTRGDQDGSGHADGGLPPYVPRRGVDAALQAAMEESALAAATRLIVLRGDPKSGKSRTLWQAAWTLRDRKLVAVTQPDPLPGRRKRRPRR